MSFFPHEVYSKCLFGAHGQPLWTPQLKIQLRDSYQLEGLRIGDVGIVSSVDGSFDVLFNITLPRNEQPYPKLIGEDYTPVTLDPDADLATQDDAVSPHGVISSECVELISQEIYSCDQKPSRADYEFSLSTGDGAVLILPEGAESCDLTNEKVFLDEAIRHGVEWYECATDPKKAGRLIGNDSLYLITGFHKTRSWSLGAARQNDSGQKKQRQIKFKVGQLHQDSVPAQAYQWTTTHGFTGRVGPTSPYEIPSHICDKRLRRGTVSVETRQGTFFGFGSYMDNLLRGRAAGPSQSSKESSTDNTVDQDFSVNPDHLYTDTRMTIDRVPDVSQTFHPGDSINRYLLKREPRAMVAITRDSLWIDMLHNGSLKVGDFARDECLQEVVSKNYEMVMENGTVYLQQCLPYGHSFTPPQDSRLTLNHETPSRAIPALSYLESSLRTASHVSTPYATGASGIDLSTLYPADALLPHIRRASWPSHPRAEYSTWMQTPPRPTRSPTSEPPESASGESDQDSDDDDSWNHPWLGHSWDVNNAMDGVPEVASSPSMIWSSPSTSLSSARLQGLDTGSQHTRKRLFGTDQNRAPVAVSSSTPLTAPPGSTNVSVGDQRPTDGPERPKRPRMYQCALCRKMFPRPGGLASHMNSHSDAKPYKCPVAGCDKGFAIRSNAKRHLRTHGINPSTSGPLSVPRFSVGFEEPMVQVHDTERQPSRYRWIPHNPPLPHNGPESSSSAMVGSSHTHRRNADE